MLLGGGACSDPRVEFQDYRNEPDQVIYSEKRTPTLVLFRQMTLQLRDALSGVIR